MASICRKLPLKTDAAEWQTNLGLRLYNPQLPTVRKSAISSESQLESLYDIVGTRVLGGALGTSGDPFGKRG